LQLLFFAARQHRNRQSRLSHLANVATTTANIAGRKAAILAQILAQQSGEDRHTARLSNII